MHTRLSFLRLRSSLSMSFSSFLPHLLSNFQRSIPSAVDVGVITMIGGRLYFHHRRQQRLGIMDSKFFVSALVICVESGLMSTLSKLVQFVIPLSDRALIVVPLVVRLSLFLWMDDI